MSIPKEILALKPTNTRVKKNKDSYACIKRTSKRVGSRIMTVELGTIGHIKYINNKWVYVPKPIKTPSLIDYPISILQYGYTRLIDLVNSDILNELKKVYPEQDALKIYVIAILRTAYSNVSKTMSHDYELDYLSIKYPNLNLSQKHLCKYYQLLGQRLQLITKYMQNRIDNSSGKIIIDGMLKNNDSITNCFSAYSYKSRLKNRKSISIIYAYDYITKEPIASKVYPGNMLDSTSLIDFLNHFSLKNGITIMDKGFNNKKVRKYFLENKDKYYLYPIKDNDTRIKEYFINKQFQGILDIQDEIVFYKKIIIDDLYLYAFKNQKIQSIEKNNFMFKYRKKENIIQLYENKKHLFGLIVFESNADLDSLNIYESYQERWNIEVFFKYYNSTLNFDTLRVQETTRALAIEFLNFLSVTMEMKIIKYYKLKNLNKEYSTKYIKDTLKKIGIIKTNNSNNTQYIYPALLKYESQLLTQLGIDTEFTN